ncbi:trans-2,3-dihydro-3-hydroxyanthranilate isomerase [Actinoplanes campanulatus]|uniref:Trans-2,3-dihydro-3-hydroxyanthranilate isomerase n=1 Tax=Actinoplanes campanulatus TaxID=113559 RepID=A0A7W5FG79_9ACTN|nr:PhzF family phenazine biosynthesis protein [Actinoplanes campanulatus]MBB3097135.1 trans-2,3-dihydro-3-hydroxyanthranilate isomerase [Actinoplanes campanulatus]GGN15929.1 phenazine biosynthesis protein [Actinoplanes campanulatus]GID37683.1 phenazine biosynthesis protein [Actinoplanes campanulatus]
MSTLAYEIVDVFTDRPFAGNPLAVVFGGARLATAQMQALAREFNLSETVFPLPPSAPGATYRARIFTPEGEIPFAGHPSVGVAVTAMRRGMFRAGAVIQECGAGLLPITVTAAGTATLTGAEPRLGAPLDPAPLLAAVGLTASDYAGDDLAAPRSAGCGLDWVLLPVRREALARARVDVAAAERAGVTDISVFSWADGEAHARVFVAGGAVPEDPATGSAALALGVWLVAAGRVPGEGVSSYRIHQGVEMKRPSRLECTVTASGGAAVSATVTGHVWPVASGEIAVPPFIG